MISIKEAEEEFLKYRNLFDLENENIQRKYNHTKNVEKNTEIISKSLNLNEEQINLAKLISLLHDIGRFEEYKEFKKKRTFLDSKPSNHAEYGVEILKKNNFIRNFVKEDNYDDLIYTAIRNHNKKEIEKNLTEEEILFSKILRDADKLDIMRLSYTTYWKEEDIDIENEIISDEVYKLFIEKQTIDNKLVINQVNKLVSKLALIFDINFRQSFIILKENDYFNKVINRFNFKNIETSDRINKIKIIGNEYINSKI